MAKRRIPQTLSPDDLAKIFKSILQEKTKRKLTPYENFLRVRNCMMILMAYLLGLRPKETTDIKLIHIDFLKNSLYIPAEHNKQRNEDKIPIPNFLMNKIISYMKLRKKFFELNEWLFPNRSGKTTRAKLERNTYATLFKSALKRARLLQISYIDKKNQKRTNYTLYSLRHSFGTFVYSKTRDIRKTALALRHYDFQCRSTLTYIHTAQSLDRLKIFDEIFKK